MKKIKIILVDDHQILLDGISALLKGDEKFEIIGEANRCSAAWQLLEKQQPDIVITDIQMPEMSGVEFTQKIKQMYPNVKVLALSMSADPGDIAAMLEAGVSGYVIKNTGKLELKNALVKIAEGGTFYSDEITSTIYTTLISKKTQEEEDKHIRLTPREEEIIRLIAKEYSNKQIAEALVISERTVETHRKNIFRKTGTKSVLGLVNWAKGRKIIL